MKSTNDAAAAGRSRTLSLVRRALMICLALVALVLAGGTVYGLFFHAGNPGYRQSSRNNQGAVSQKNGEGQTFTSIGRIRVPTADPQPEMVILFVSFVYYPDDRAFSEELALRVRDFRDIITGYIGSFPSAELQEISEDSIKTEILRRFNAILRLGQIETLNLSDFMIVG